ncbi:LysR family transcriptional regulator [Paraneptunicella aestuarii]|uniref:LysR family transcriptional regulator n=1 Tax=Paraneptunicella aestuarii TaxID=2831148 RepID=UPI001E57B131|nr:LysR family transcriptional regulator [Paraneptunicella aestuarii]UAA40205.1 LysR family transcriptional regulator [Paraneptunicella aestuarii]
MNISLKQVKAFVKVAQCRNYAEAAERLHVSQPALSIAIRNLEQTIGGALFSRSTRKVELTPEGQEFFPVAKRLLQDWEEACSDLNNLFSLQKGKLTIAVMPSFADTMLPKVLLAFHDSYPNISISVQDVVMESAMNAVRESRAELGITFESDTLDGLDFLPLFDNDCVLICQPEHELALQNEVDWDQISAFPFVAMNWGSTMRRWIDEASVEHNLTLNITAEAGQLVTLGQFVAVGMGISVVPALCRIQMENKGLVCRPIRNSGLIKQVGIVRRQRGSLSVAANAFMELLLAEKFDI